VLVNGVMCDLFPQLAGGVLGLDSANDGVRLDGANDIVRLNVANGTVLCK